jgi:hypothetical protein
MIDSRRLGRSKFLFPGKAGVFSGRAFFFGILFLFLFFTQSLVLQAHPFQPGEKLTYVLKLRGIPLGRQVFEVRDGMRIRGRSTHLLFCSVKSSPFLSFFYYINDELESFADIDTLYSLRSRIRFREGRHSRNYEVEIDMDRMRALFEDKNSKKRWEQEVSLPIFDLVSLIYWLRTQNHRVGETFSVFFIDTGLTYGKVKEIKIDVAEAEQVSTYVGAFSAIRYSEAGGDNRITVWISREEGNIPVKLQLSTRLGVITAYLAKVEGRRV